MTNLLFRLYPCSIKSAHAHSPRFTCFNSSDTQIFLLISSRCQFGQRLRWRVEECMHDNNGKQYLQFLQSSAMKGFSTIKICTYGRWSCICKHNFLRSKIDKTLCLLTAAPEPLYTWKGRLRWLTRSGFGSKLWYWVWILTASDTCHRGCAYTVLQIVERSGVCSAVYGAEHYKEPLKSFNKSRP